MQTARTSAESHSMMFAGLLMACLLVSLLAKPPVAEGSSGPIITSVAFSISSGSYTVTVNGTGFGSISDSLPFTGDTGYLRMGDAAQTGNSEWGYTGDTNHLTYDSWTNTQIVVGGFGGSAGDAVTIALWNPTTNLGVTWGGNVPPIPDTPQITSVTFSGSGQATSMTIVGSGFGSAPVSMPYTGDLNYFNFIDFATHCGASSSAFGAGFNGWGKVSSDGVTVDFESWTNTLIQISGFGGTYGQGCASASLGDPIVIYIWSTSDSAVIGPQTASGAFLSTTTPVTTTTTATVTSPTTTTATVTSPTTTTATSTTTTLIPTTITPTVAATLTSTYSTTPTSTVTSTTTDTTTETILASTSSIFVTTTAASTQTVTTVSVQPATTTVTTAEVTTVTGAGSVLYYVFVAFGLLGAAVTVAWLAGILKSRHQSN